MYTGLVIYICCVLNLSASIEIDHLVLTFLGYNQLKSGYEQENLIELRTARMTVPLRNMLSEIDSVNQIRQVRSSSGP